MDENLDEIKWKLKKYGQEHLLNGYDKLEDKNKLEDRTIVNNTNSNANITDDQYFDDFFQDE